MKNKKILKTIVVAVTSFALAAISTAGVSSAEGILIFSNETGTENGNTLVLDSDDTGGDVTLQFGETLSEQLYWDNTAGQFVFTDDLNVTGNLDVDGTITAGSSNITITDATGNLDGEQIAADTIDEDSIDFGTGAGQVGAVDVPTTDEFANSDSTNVQDVLDDLDAAIGGGGNPTSTTSNTFTLDSDDTGGNVDMIFGTTIAQYIRHDGSLFHFSDDVLLDGANSLQFRDSALAINSSVDGQLDIDADTEVEITATTVDLNGNLDVSGTITGATIDGDDNTLQDIAFSSLSTRTKTMFVTMNDLTVLLDGTNNAANVYTDSESGVNPHQYYLVQSGNGSLQDLDLKIKVKLPEDFVDFTTATTDLSFFYQNTGTDDTDSKIDILVEDDDGDDAFTAVDGEGLFNLAWTEHTDEFDGGSFNPAGGEYIYITVKGYSSKTGPTNQDAYVGEIVLTYTGR